METQTKLIEIEHLSKNYGGQAVLDDVSLSFEAGKIHGLIGHNGSGKTLLLKAIAGLIRPSSGRVLVRGQEVGKEMDFPHGIGVLIEKPGFLPQYNALANLKMFSAMRAHKKTKEIKELLQLVGLNPLDRKHVGKFSLGMKQRFGLAQALLDDPEILLLDEAMNGLDRQGIAEMRQLLMNLREQGKTLIIATHLAEDIRTLCDSVTEMEGGKMLSVT